MAGYWYATDRLKSNAVQVAAHRQNRYLMKPREGMEFTTICLTEQKRIENVIAWMQQFKSFPELLLKLEAILGDLAFGVESDRFEEALHRLGGALGFACQRPDKEWKEGPDNLWAIKDGQYLVTECKSEVDLNRESINKHETGQMNNSIAWFKRNYPSAKAKRIIIIPTKKIGAAGGFNEPVEIMRRPKLERLVKNSRSFFLAFKTIDFHTLSADQVQKTLNAHGLSVLDLLNNYAEEPFQMT